MFICNNSLIIYQPGLQHPFLAISLPINETANFMLFGNKGNGPGEIIAPDVRSFDYSDKGFSLFDAGGICKSYEFFGDSLVFTGDKRFAEIKGPTNGMYPLKDGFLNINLSDPNYEFEMYLRGGKRVNKCLYPNWGQSTQEADVTRYLKQVAVHPNGSRALVLYAFFSKGRLLNGRGVILKEITVKIKDGSYYDAMMHKNIFYSSYPCADERNIYAKYGLDEIHVFDWDGNLVKRIHVDRAFDLFSIDYKNDMLYAISFSDSRSIYRLKIH